MNQNNNAKDNNDKNSSHQLRPAKPKDNGHDNVNFLAKIVKDVKKTEDGTEGNSTLNPVIHVENDIKALESGFYLKKMHPKKLKFNKRKYKIDTKNKKLVASSKYCFMREKICIKLI